MSPLRPPIAGLLLVVLLASARCCLARGPSPARPMAVLRASEGTVVVRCSHVRVKSWRGVELHSGDTLRVGTRGWASVSIEATGARFLLVAGASVRVEAVRLHRLSGPLPHRSFDLPTRGSATPESNPEPPPPPIP